MIRFTPKARSFFLRSMMMVALLAFAAPANATPASRPSAASQPASRPAAPPKAVQRKAPARTKPVTRAAVKPSPTRAAPIRPAVRAAAQPPVRAALRPAARPVKAGPLKAQIDAKGGLSVSRKALSLGQFSALLMGWKRQGTPTTLSLHVAANAPKVRVMVITELLKDAGVKWTRANQPIAKRPPAARPLGSVWSRAPLTYQRKMNGQPKLIELRGQVLRADRTPYPAAFVGLVLRRANKRDPVAVLRSNMKGYFRFRFKGEEGVVFRLSLLQGTKVHEFPIPWRRAVKGVLYLRVAMPTSASAKPAPVRPAPARPTPVRPAPARPTPARPAPARRTPTKRAPARPVRRTPVVAKRPSPKIHATAAQGKAAKTPCVWDKAPKGRAKGLLPARRIGLRVQLMKLNGVSAGRLPTGIVRVVNGKSQLVARTFSSKQGCLVYEVDRTAPGFYQLFIFSSGKVNAHRIPKLSKDAKVLQVPVWLSPKKAQKVPETKFLGLLMFFEQVSLDWVKVNFVATLYFMPTPDKPRAPLFVLPLPKGAVRLRLDKDLQSRRPVLRKDGLHLRRLKAGRNRLWYNFLLPRNTDAEVEVKVSFGHQIKHVRAYFEKGKLKPGGIKKPTKTVMLGGKKHQTAFKMLQFAEAQPNQVLRFVVAAHKQPPGGLIGWIARMKRHRKKNKLLGLGLLLAITCLGLCWLVIIPRQRNPAPPSDA